MRITRSLVTAAAFVAVALGVVSAQAPTSSSVLANVDIQKILVERVDSKRQSVGIVVGVIEPAGRRIVARGSLAAGDARVLDGDTVFEIGSITKVFTSLLLADAVERQQLALDDPVSKFLTSDVRMPERGRAITLRDLSNHTSGLPRLPGNLKPKDPQNPYADYTIDQLYRFLSSYQLPRDVGAQFEYSNLGGGLLGHVLARQTGTEYATLVNARILDPLRMSSTAVVITPRMKDRLATGHTASLVPTRSWDPSVLAGAGALRSTANDMLTFLAGVLGYINTPLASAMARMTAGRQSTGSPGLEIGLGWLILTANGKEIVWHNGGTGGYRSFIGYDAKARTGVVVLSNASTAAGVDDIGFGLLSE
jgi:CubicO group peptidase (beta-lactamase class C family)